MLTVLGGLAEFERELIRARTGEGRKRAQERGVRFGRPRKLTAHQRPGHYQSLGSRQPFRARRGRRPVKRLPCVCTGLLTPHRLSSEGDTMNIRLPAATEHPGRME